jgi:putative redox protein
MTVEARALTVPWQVEYTASGHTGIADTIKQGFGGSAGLRPHELLEAALAACMTITARMYLHEHGADDTGTGVAVEVVREETASTFRYRLTLPPETEAHRAALMARLAGSPVRTTLSRTLSFQASPAGQTDAV